MPKGLETVGVWLAIGVMIVVASIEYRTTEGLVDTSRWVEHTQQVIQAFDDVLLGTTAAGRSRRTFWITGDDAEVARVSAAIARTEDALAQAHALTADSPLQRARLGQLDPMIEARFADIRGAIDLQRASSGPRDEGTEDAVLRRGNEAMRLIASIIEDAGRQERDVLAERQRSARRSAAFAKSTNLAGTGISVALLIFAFARLRRENERRVVSERALRASEQFLDSIVEHIPDMVFVKEATELRFQRMNRAGEVLLGMKRDDLLGKNDYDFFPKAEADFFQARDRQTLSCGMIVDIVEEPISTTSGVRWLHTKKVPLLDEDGRPRFLLGISEDITERKQTAEALREAIVAAESANRELEAFSYSVAHDLRAPLRSIDGFSQAILEDCAELDEVGKTHLHRVRGSAARMGELIDGLLGLSRLTRSEMRVELVDLSALATTAVEELREHSPGREVRVQIAPALGARGDPRILRIVVDNLFGNAFKFTATRPQATIEFGVRADSGARVFFVRDNGVGFDSRYKHKLFGAFQRLHSARDFPGTGIGLATVQRAIKRHGGRVWAESEPGCGATFFFTLNDGPASEQIAG